MAERPATHAATYAQVRATAFEISGGGPFVDSVTPAGYFGLTVQNMGGVQTYWFRGALGDPGAQVVARTQFIHGSPAHYVGGSLAGCTYTTETGPQ